MSWRSACSHPALSTCGIEYGTRDDEATELSGAQCVTGLCLRLGLYGAGVLAVVGWGSDGCDAGCCASGRDEGAGWDGAGEAVLDPPPKMAAEDEVTAQLGTPPAGMAVCARE